jgi:hypothetical protein
MVGRAGAVRQELPGYSQGLTSENNSLAQVYRPAADIGSRSSGLMWTRSASTFEIYQREHRQMGGRVSTSRPTLFLPASSLQPLASLHPPLLSGDGTSSAAPDPALSAREPTLPKAAGRAAVTFSRECPSISRRMTARGRARSPTKAGGIYKHAQGFAARAPERDGTYGMYPVTYHQGPVLSAFQ